MNDMYVSDLFLDLNPHVATQLIEKTGHRTTGLCIQLNSYENRVYELELITKERVVAKFYRPKRWSKEAIEEEHQFLLELKNEEIPVAAPLLFENKQTLTYIESLYATAFPKISGRSPDEISDVEWQDLGRILGRIHNIGARTTMKNRPTLSAEHHGDLSLELLLEKNFIPEPLQQSYVQTAEFIFDNIENKLKQFAFIRLHGDFHRGNLLRHRQNFYVVDFDDAMMGPEVQDMWLLSVGRDAEAQRQRDLLLKGYTQIRSFDNRQLELIEPLRGLRIVHYSAWIAKRFHDPAFIRTFEYFRDIKYWEDELNQLREIAARLSS